MAAEGSSPGNPDKRDDLTPGLIYTLSLPSAWIVSAYRPLLYSTLLYTDPNTLQTTSRRDPNGFHIVFLPLIFVLSLVWTVSHPQWVNSLSPKIRWYTRPRKFSILILTLISERERKKPRLANFDVCVSRSFTEFHGSLVS